MLPQDPVMLLSYVNMKLRDQYVDLKSMCDDLGVDENEIVKKLESIQYHYEKERNAFV